MFQHWGLKPVLHSELASSHCQITVPYSLRAHTSHASQQTVQSGGAAPQDLEVLRVALQTSIHTTHRQIQLNLHCAVTEISKLLTCRERAAYTTAIGREDSKQIYTQKFLFLSSQAISAQSSWSSA